MQQSAREATAGPGFDAKTDRHYHLVCLECEKIIDLKDERLNAVALPGVSYRGFETKEFQIYFRGLCGECHRRVSPSQGSSAFPARGVHAERARLNPK